MSRVRFSLPLVLASLALAACGGHPTVTKVTVPPKATVAAKAAPVPVKVASGHVCDVKDYAMGCALPPQSLPDVVRAPNAVSTTAPSIQGVDFGWSCPVSSARNFGASYVSYDTSKDWTRSCVDAFHAQHKGTVAVWEAGAKDACSGSSALGRDQARLAAQLETALGAGPHQPIPMAIDNDCTPSVSYFRGANAAEPGRIDAYGGYNQILYLYQRHLVGHANWQTYAWSGGRWLPASIAPLEQYLNSSSVDYDRAIAAYYGQWPYNPPKSKPTIVCFGSHRQRSRLCDKVRHADAVLGHRRDQELGYLKVSNAAAAKLQAQVSPLQRRLAQIDGRAALELRKGQFAALRVSATNAVSVQARLAPAQRRLAAVEARVKLEQAKAALYNRQLVASLRQYGYHHK